MAAAQSLCVADGLHISARDAFSGLRVRDRMPTLRVDARRLFVATGLPPPCADAFTPGTTAGQTRGRGADRAIDWAGQQSGSLVFASAGLEFIAQAFRSAGVEVPLLARAASVNEAFERCAQDGKIRQDALIPRGAIVFWQGLRRDGHVALSLGNGSVIDGGRRQPQSGSRVWTLAELSRAEGRGPAGWMLP